MRQAVEGANPHAGRVDTHQLLDALAHLGSGLVGEGHRQDGVGRGVFDLDQPGDTVHQHSGFTGTSTGQDQLTTHGGSYGLALGIVEGVQQKGEIIAHRGILGGRDTPGKPRFALTDESYAKDDRSVIGCRHWRGVPSAFSVASASEKIGDLLISSSLVRAIACVCSEQFRAHAHHYKNKNIAYDPQLRPVGPHCGAPGDP
ncbi:hypothetical protein D3C84_364300 [compost metagenome]